MDEIDHGPGFCQVNAASQYDRVVPYVVNAASPDQDMLRWLYRTVSEPSVATPAEGYVYISSGYLFDGKHITDDAGEWVKSSIVDWQPTPEVLGYIEGLKQRGEVRSFPSAPGEAVLVHFAQINIGNYGHFLCENAPKLVNIARAGHRRIRLLLPHEALYAASFILAILADLGVAAEILPIEPASLYRLGPVLHFTPVARHNFRKSFTLLAFREVALRRYGSSARGTSVFVKRAPAARRKLSNQNELADALAERSYVAVEPGGLSIEDQVALFSQAGSIVGSVGAGLTNMLFAPERTRVLYLCNGMVDLFFWDIAGLCKQDFTWFFAQPPLRWDPGIFTADYTADCAAVLHALQLTRFGHA